MASIISLIGWSNTGKTTLTVKLIEEMTRRGYRIAALKNSHHHLKMDKPGSDTDLFAQAGASGVGLSHGEGMTLFLPPGQWSVEMLERFFPRADFIIGEGLKIPEVFRIQAAGAKESVDELKGSPDQWNLVLTESPHLKTKLKELGVPTLSFREIGRICDLLEGLGAEL